MSSDRTELRIEFGNSADDLLSLATLDAYCMATDRHRTDVVKKLVVEWSERKRHEATLIARVACGNPTQPETHRK